jgi:plasmid stability protein
MATLRIRNLDERVVERLRLLARHKGTSVEEEACRLLAEGTRPSRTELAAFASAMRARQRPNKTRAARLIRVDRGR